MTNLIGA